MAKTIDITDKLAFDENPKLVVKGKELEVNADATTVLKIMGILGDGDNVQPSDVVKMYELIFSDADRKKIDKMKLQFADFQTLVFSAIGLSEPKMTRKFWSILARSRSASEWNGGRAGQKQCLKRIWRDFWNP